jgi:hypothetical protein
MKSKTKTRQVPNISESNRGVLALIAVSGLGRTSRRIQIRTMVFQFFRTVMNGAGFAKGLSGDPGQLFGRQPHGNALRSW